MNASVRVEEDGERIVFLRKISPGEADKSYGVQVARLAGLPPLVIQRAQQILQTLERAHTLGHVVQEVPPAYDIQLYIRKQQRKKLATAPNCNFHCLLKIPG